MTVKEATTTTTKKAAPRKRVAKTTETTQAEAPPTKMSTQHKAALATGRDESRIIRHYLEGLQETKPKRGRKRTPASIETRLQKIEDSLLSANGLERVQLIQERINLWSELGTGAPVVDMATLEENFLRVVWDYSQRKGLTFDAWREAGVPATVLKQAGIHRL